MNGDSNFEQPMKQSSLHVHGDGKVLVLYMSGLIGAEEALYETHLRIVKGGLEDRIRSNFYLCDLPYTQANQTDGCLVTPLSPYKRRTVYKVKEMDPIQDSRQITFSDVLKLAELIKEQYQKYRAFIVLSGIATITYVGSILSFLLENLHKTIIITGALLPLSTLRNDAFQNILNSLTLAGHFDIPEVLIVMDRKGFRANRCRQLDQACFECVDSPNFPQLIDFGINIDIQWQYVLRRGEITEEEQHTYQLQLAPPFVTNILVVKLTPFMSIDHFKYVLNTPGLRCCVFECYHFSDIPHSDELINILNYAQHTLGVLIVTISQCVRSNSSNELKQVNEGIIVRYDITPESAVAKIGYLLGKGYSNSQVRVMFHQNIQGEIGSVSQVEKFEGKHQHFILTLAEHLQKNTGDDQISKCMEFINKYCLPNLACYMAINNRLSLLKDIQTMHGNLNMPDFDDRTPLHLAAAESQFDIIRFLVEDCKVDINPIDYLGYSPMFEALAQRNKQLLFYFRQHGGIIKAPQAGEDGDVDMLEMIYHGGLKNLNDYVNIDNRNVAHMAVLSGQINVLYFLKKIAHFDFSQTDRWNNTPLKDAINAKDGIYIIPEIPRIDTIIDLLQQVNDY